MGQMTRQAKYDKFWATIDETIEARGDVIDYLLRLLSNAKLDDALQCCAECRVEHHDQCSMTDGCPCCDDTRRNEDH